MVPEFQLSNRQGSLDHVLDLNPTGYKNANVDKIEDKIRIWSFYFKIKINPSHKTSSMILNQLLTMIKSLHFELPSDDVIGFAILCCL